MNKNATLGGMMGGVLVTGLGAQALQKRMKNKTLGKALGMGVMFAGALGGDFIADDMIRRRYGSDAVKEVGNQGKRGMGAGMAAKAFIPEAAFAFPMASELGTVAKLEHDKRASAIGGLAGATAVNAAMNRAGIGANKRLLGMIGGYYLGSSLGNTVLGSRYSNREMNRIGNFSFVGNMAGFANNPASIDSMAAGGAIGEAIGIGAMEINRLRGR